MSFHPGEFGLLLLAFLEVGKPAGLAAQCPDGSPPPCGRAAVRQSAPNSVAVLYLDNLSRDTADAYLADGLTEEIIIRLGQVQRLVVKSRFEVQRFRGRAIADPTALGRSLNAAYLVTGSVQRAGDQVRLRAALVRAATGAQIWGDVFDRSDKNLLTVESDIARAVTAAIAGQLLPEERARLDRPLTTDPIAYQEYLRGTQALSNSFDEASLRSALAHFDRAIARDSDFAAAFAGEAAAWEGLADGYLTGREGYGRAATAAREAITRDSLLAPPYAWLSFAVLAVEFDGREAERLARRAVTLGPRSAEAHAVLGQALYARGRLDEALSEARRAWDLDSLSANSGYYYIDMLLFTHGLDSAAAFLPRYRQVAPAAEANQLTGRLLAARGDLRGAAHLLNWRDYGGGAAGTYVRALLAGGDTVAALATVDSMLAARATGYFNPLALARAYTALGDVDRGMKWLQQAFEERTIWLIDMRRDDELAPLRGDPRYAALDRLLQY